MHQIFQRHGITPDEIYAKDRRHRRFIYASMLVLFEDEEKARKEAERERAGRR